VVLRLAKHIQDVPQCGVCAKGAAFIAAVDRFNRLKICFRNANGNNTSYYDEGFLTEYFSQGQLDEMEAAFEGWPSYRLDSKFSYTGIPRNRNKADIRLSMIMQNVIRNNGEFVPEQFIQRMKTKGFYAKV